MRKLASLVRAAFAYWKGGRGGRNAKTSPPPTFFMCVGGSSCYVKCVGVQDAPAVLLAEMFSAGALLIKTTALCHCVLAAMEKAGRQWW